MCASAACRMCAAAAGLRVTSVPSSYVRNVLLVLVGDSLACASRVIRAPNVLSPLIAAGVGWATFVHHVSYAFMCNRFVLGVWS